MQHIMTYNKLSVGGLWLVGLVVLLLLVCDTCQTSQQQQSTRTIYVATTGTKEGPGTFEQPFNDISIAVGVAQQEGFDIVQVLPGTYTTTSKIQIQRSLVLQGTQANNTFIQCGNQYPRVAVGVLSNTTVGSSITITKITMRHCEAGVSSYVVERARQFSLAVTDCVFTNNTLGVEIVYNKDTALSTAIKLSDCVFDNNRIAIDYLIQRQDFDVVFSTVTRCKFTENTQSIGAANSDSLVMQLFMCDLIGTPAGTDVSFVTVTNCDVQLRKCNCTDISFTHTGDISTDWSVSESIMSSCTGVSIGPQSRIKSSTMTNSNFVAPADGFGYVVTNTTLIDTKMSGYVEFEHCSITGSDSVIKGNGYFEDTQIIETSGVDGSFWFKSCTLKDNNPTFVCGDLQSYQLVNTTVTPNNLPDCVR